MNKQLLSAGVPRLPRLVFKSELALYFDVSSKYLWSTMLTEELFEEWGYDRDDFKTAKRFPPKITKLIYKHFEIFDLDATLVEELAREDLDEEGHRAPKDD